MRIVYFTHSLVSCWNNGNAHFQRGIFRALKKLGHEVAAWEPVRGWSRDNLLADQGQAAANSFTQTFPDLTVSFYDGLEDLPRAVDGANLVIVHEWNDPALVWEVGRLHRNAPFVLLFHDTHHRAVSDPDAIRRFDLSGYDGVLAFGAALARVYEGWGWGGRIFVWHEAADTSLFQPPSEPTTRENAVWIGNWGEGERAAELETFLLAPAQRARTTLHIQGVRYPRSALDMLNRYGAHFQGWLANARVPEIFARYLFTIHVPRRYYSDVLPGIPTIRVFEALACGLPLITAPWDDSEHLFDAGSDYLVARSGAEMERHMRSVANDAALANALAEAGLSRIRSRHSCDIRAGELLGIVGRLSSRAAAA